MHKLFICLVLWNRMEQERRLPLLQRPPIPGGVSPRPEEEPMQRSHEQGGFTLIELMIVVVIVGILSALAIPRFTSVSNQARQAEAGPILKQICALAEAESLRTNVWPSELTAVAVPGWIAPARSRFTFTLTGGGAGAASAVATPDAANGGEGLTTQSMECETKQIS